jgi:hypothetical protein
MGVAPDRTGSVLGLTRRSFHRIAFTDWGRRSPIGRFYAFMASHGMGAISIISLPLSPIADAVLFVPICRDEAGANG